MNTLRESNREPSKWQRQIVSKYCPNHFILQIVNEMNLWKPIFDCVLNWDNIKNENNKKNAIVINLIYHYFLVYIEYVHSTNKDDYHSVSFI